MDIISNLQSRKMLGEIAVEILACLNATDLRMAEKVSHDWKEAVMSGKLWQKLFKRNMLLHPPWRKMSNIVRKQNPNILPTFNEEEKHLKHWHDQLMYRKICLLIEESLKILEKNWLTANYQEEIVHRGLISGPVNSIAFLMNEEHIVRHVDSEKVFKFYNRWSLQLEEEIPSRSESNLNNRYFVTCFDFNDQLLVIGYGNGVVDVIDRHSVQIVHSFRDFDWPSNQYISFDFQDDFSTEKVILSPKGQFLLSYLYTSTSFFLTLRKIANLKEMTVIQQIQLDESVEELVNLYMDDSFTVLFMRARSGRGQSTELFEIRSTESFIPLHSIEIEHVVSAYHYLNGLLVVGSRPGNSQVLSIWEAKTGACVRKVEVEKEKTVDLRIISDKYVVSVNDSGEMKQWDVQALLNPSFPADKAVLHKIGSSKMLSTCVGGGMVADEYQVVLFGFFRTAPKGQTENPIIVSLDFMKGQNLVKRPLPELY